MKSALFLASLLALSCSSAEAATSDYSRDKFGKGGWLDEDHDCQDTRAEMLIATSLVPVTFTTVKHCYVSRGLWVDYYAQTLQRSASLLDVDHVVPLAEAWRSGAAGWTQEQREDFANDPRELVVTLSAINRTKSDHRPDAWLPSNPVAKCVYLNQWLEIKTNWGLSMTDTERTVVDSCKE
jgi:hypothetical protein